MTPLRQALIAVCDELEKHDPVAPALHFARGILSFDETRSLGRPRASFDDLPGLVAAYNGGASIASLAEGEGVCYATMRRALKDAGASFGARADRWADSITPDRAEEIKRLYAEGVSTYDLAQLVGVGVPTISRALRGWGVKLRPKGPPKGRRSKNHLSAILEMRSKGATSQEIGRALGISRERVRQIVVREGLKEEFAERPFRPEEIEALESYREGGSIELLASKLGVHYNTARKMLDRAGIPVRPSKKRLGQKKAREEKARQIAERYKAGENPADIARAFGMTNPAAIYRYLSIAGVRPNRIITA